MGQKRPATAFFTEPKTFTSGIEGPAVDSQGNLYAVCVTSEYRNTIGKVTPSGGTSLFLVLPPGSSGCGMRYRPVDDCLYVADHTGHNVLRVDIRTKAVTVYAHDSRMNQPNDLAITRSGVLFASDPNWDRSSGQLWRIDPGGATVLLEAEMGTTNGIEVSPDESTLYVNESIGCRVWAYDLLGAGEVANKRLIHQFDDHLLDGMRCDADGNLYVTRYGAGVIAILSPIGELLREVKLIGSQCTNLTFGGEDGRSCFITMADHGNIEVFRTDSR